MLGAFIAGLVALVVLALFESYRVALSACQFFLRLSASSCPADGSSVEPRPSKDGAAVDHPEVSTPYSRQGKLFSRSGDLSSPLLACSQADLVSAARRLDRFSSAPRRRFGRPPIFQPTAEHLPPPDGHGGPFALAVPLLAAIDPSPDFGAFGAGVELGIFTALFTISSLLVLNWIVKTMRSSN